MIDFIADPISIYSIKSSDAYTKLGKVYKMNGTLKMLLYDVAHLCQIQFSHFSILHSACQ